jgi:hypothetical protein
VVVNTRSARHARPEDDRKRRTTMLNIETVRAIKRLVASDVTSAYSGKPGCMCGCNGNYRYYSAEYFKKFGPGYGEAEEEVNPAQVRKVLTVIQTAVNIDANDVEAIRSSSCKKGEVILSFDFSEKRVYVVYLTPGASATFPEKFDVEYASQNLNE